MSKINLKRSFGKWYKRNKKRFKYQPIFSKRHWNYIVFTFQGITPKLVSIIKQQGTAEIWVIHNKEGWDIITDFDVSTSCTALGQYYCALCLPGYLELFPSRQVLWEKHCFEPLLEWINENLIESRWVGLFQVRGGTWVEMKGKEEIGAMRAKDEFVEAFPIVQTQKFFQ